VIIDDYFAAIADQPSLSQVLRDRELVRAIASAPARFSPLASGKTPGVLVQCPILEKAVGEGRFLCSAAHDQQGLAHQVDALFDGQ